MSTRRQRAFTQPIYLLKMNPITQTIKRSFKVVGSTGTLYTVNIQQYPSCTCPDHEQNYKICKHLYFIFLRVMKVNSQIKNSYKDYELVQMFNNIPPYIDHNVAFNKTTETNYNICIVNGIGEIKKITQKFNDACPICLDDIISDSNNVDYCKYGCGKSVHKKCFKMWNNVSHTNKCAFCRNDWHDECEKMTNKYDESNSDNDESDNENNESDIDNKSNSDNDESYNDNELDSEYIINELVSKYRIIDLQNLCKNNSLPFYGTKLSLVNRLIDNHVSI